MFLKRKFSLHQQQDLQHIVSDLSYSCGATMDHVDLPDNFKFSVWRSTPASAPI